MPIPIFLIGEMKEIKLIIRRLKSMHNKLSVSSEPSKFAFKEKI